jgi:glycosyltransferase involved in cell wall biosynthesis
VVDTGSTDESVKVATELGAKVFYFAWCNDFAKARNQSIKHAQGEWVLWLDADELLLEEDLLNLRELLTKSPAETDCYQLPIYQCVPFVIAKEKSSYRYKLFRNFRGFFFARPINECLVKPNGHPLEGPACEASIYHFGNLLSIEKLKDKNLRYIEIFAGVIEKHPEDPYYRLLLADRYFAICNFAEALGSYRIAGKLFASKELMARAKTGEAACLHRLGEKELALEIAQGVLEIQPDFVRAYNLIALIYVEKNCFAEAVICFETAHQINPNPFFDQKIRQLKNLINKGGEQNGS